MKSLTVALIALISLSAQAKVPNEVSKLDGRLGKFTSVYNGKINSSESGTDCKLEIGPNNTIVIDSVAYFVPTADFDGAIRTEENGEVVYETNYNGKKPGGSVCGTHVQLTSYKQYVIIRKNSVTIKQQYSCAYSSKEITETCTIR